MQFSDECNFVKEEPDPKKERSGFFYLHLPLKGPNEELQRPFGFPVSSELAVRTLPGLEKSWDGNMGSNRELTGRVTSVSISHSAHVH